MAKADHVISFGKEFELKALGKGRARVSIGEC